MFKTSKLVMTVIFIISVVALAFTSFILIATLVGKVEPDFQSDIILSEIAMIIAVLYFVAWSGYRLFTSLKSPGPYLRRYSRKDAIIMLIATIILILILCSIVVGYGSVTKVYSDRYGTIISVIGTLTIMSVIKIIRIVGKIEYPSRKRKMVKLSEKGAFIFALIVHVLAIIILLLLVLSIKDGNSQVERWPLSMFISTMFIMHILNDYWNEKQTIERNQPVSKFEKIFLIIGGVSFVAFCFLIFFRLLNAFKPIINPLIGFYQIAFCEVTFYHIEVIFLISALLGEVIKNANLEKLKKVAIEAQAE